MAWYLDVVRMKHNPRKDRGIAYRWLLSPIFADALAVKRCIISDNSQCAWPAARHLPNCPYSASGPLARLKSTLRPPHCVVGS